MTQAWTTLTPYISELFASDALEARLVGRGVTCARRELLDPWRQEIGETASAAQLIAPPVAEASASPRQFHGSGWQGQHTEYLGHMLAEMQSLARLHPDATW